VCPWASGTFRQALAGTGQDSTIVVCKLGWWTGVPWDVRAYAAGHSTYPADSTLEQLYDSAEVDACRELGACSVRPCGRASASRLRRPSERDKREEQQ
jgi:hypothetical protein